MATWGAELERLSVPVGPKSDFVELLQRRFEQQTISVETAKEALEIQLAEAEARSCVALSEMTLYRDCLRDEVFCLSSDGSVFSVEFKAARRQLRAARAEIGTVSGQLTEQKSLKGEALQKSTDVQDEPDGAKANTTQFEGCERGAQGGLDRILR